MIAIGVVPSVMALTALRIDHESVGKALTPTPSAKAAVLPANEPQAIVESLAGQEFHRADDGLFYVKAMVNGREIKFLVDTGASVVVLTTADAAAIGLKIGQGHFNASVETVGGSTPMAMTTLETMRVAGRDVKAVQAAVVQGGLGVSLLGQNALSQLGSVTISGDKLIFH